MPSSQLSSAFSLGRPTSPETSQFGATSAELPLLLDLHQVARLTSLGYQSIRNQIHKGRLPFRTVLVGSRRLVRTSDLLAWIDSLGSSNSGEGINTPSSAAHFGGTRGEVTSRRGRPRQASKSNGVNSLS